MKTRGGNMSTSSQERKPVPIFLALVGTGEDVPEDPAAAELCAKKYESSNGSIRLIVTVGRTIDAELANLIVALVFQEMSKISNKTKIEKIKFSDLCFTRDGANSLKGFLTAHASTITHVALKGFVARNSAQREEDEANFNLVAQAFETSKLEVVNLSDNLIGAYMWKNLAHQIHLKQLLLDQVEMDEKSIVQLSAQMTYARSLENIYIVLSQPASEIAILTLCDTLATCRNVTSFRWTNASPTPQSKLPWSGVQQMVSMANTSTPLRHLVMDGGLITVSELGNDGFCGALKKMVHLETLKLRDVGLRDNGVRSIMSALEVSRPPLEWLDLSGNMIELEGAKAIAQLVKVDEIMSNMEVLVLEHNKIDTEAGALILEAFAPKVLEDFEIRLDMNPMNYSQLALNMARANIQASSKKRGRRDHDLSMVSRESDTSSLASAAEMQKLQAQCEALKRERDVLAQAFSLIGVAHEVSQQKQLLERLSTLEALVKGLDPCCNSKILDTRSHLAQRNHLLGPMSEKYPTCMDTPTSTTISLGQSNTSSQISSWCHSSGEMPRVPSIPNHFDRSTDSNNPLNAVEESPTSSLVPPGAQYCTKRRTSASSSATNQSHRNGLQRSLSTGSDLVIDQGNDSACSSQMKPVVAQTVNMRPRVARIKPKNEDLLNSGTSSVDVPKVSAMPTTNDSRSQGNGNPLLSDKEGPSNSNAPMPCGMQDSKKGRTSTPTLSSTNHSRQTRLQRSLSAGSDIVNDLQKQAPPMKTAFSNVTPGEKGNKTQNEDFADWGFSSGDLPKVSQMPNHIDRDSRSAGNSKLLQVDRGNPSNALMPPGAQYCTKRRTSTQTTSSAPIHSRHTRLQRSLSTGSDIVSDQEQNEIPAEKNSTSQISNVPPNVPSNFPSGEGRIKPQNDISNVNLQPRNRKIRTSSFCKTNMVAVDRLGPKSKDPVTKAADSAHVRQESRAARTSITRMKTQRVLVEKAITESAENDELLAE